jgi:hypothetical protein
MNEVSAKSFKENGYCLVQNALDQKFAGTAALYTLFKDGDDKLNSNEESNYSDPFTESLLAHMKPTIEEFTGINVLPTYSTFLINYNGKEVEELKSVKKSQEITAFLCVGYDYDSALYYWDIKVGDKVFQLNPGDMIIYRANDVTFSRPFFKPRKDFFESNIILNYVKKDELNFNMEYDGREFLGIKP